MQFSRKFACDLFYLKGVYLDQINQTLLDSTWDVAQLMTASNFYFFKPLHCFLLHIPLFQILQHPQLQHPEFLEPALTADQSFSRERLPQQPQHNQTRQLFQCLHWILI